MTTIRPLAKTADSDHLLREACAAAGIEVDADGEPTGPVSEAQVQRLVDSLDVKAVWRVAARRVMRQFD
jgi:hypothetical protein